MAAGRLPSLGGSKFACKDACLLRVAFCTEFDLVELLLLLQALLDSATDKSIFTTRMRLAFAQFLVTLEFNMQHFLGYCWSNFVAVRF